MDAAFVIVIAKRPGVDASGMSPSSPSSSVLGFPARHRFEWAVPTGTVHLVAWHTETERDAGAWHEQGDQVAFLAGHLRWRGQAWGGPGSWAEDLARGARAYSVDELHDALRGVFIAGSITREGDGWVITDVLGLRCVYWGEDDEVVVVSSRAALVAHALARGARPPREPDASQWLAFTGYHLGDRTGYAGVHVVAPGARLRLDAGVPVWEHTHPLVVAATDELRRHTVGELAAIVQDDVAESLRAALSHPADRHVIRLTGGKDSRLVLAVALRAGLADDFVYETVGPPDLADVQLAGALCEAFGLRHEKPFMELGHSEPFGDRFSRFVGGTASMVSGWDMHTPTGTRDLRLTGLCGEPLRRYVQLRDEQLRDGVLPQAFPRRAYGRLGLLRPGLGDDLHRQLLDLLATDPAPAADPRDRVHALFAGGRMRFTRLGPREELVGDPRFQPLYSRTTVRAAMAMDPVDRTAEILFAEVMQRAARVLVEYPFTDAGWDERAQAYLGMRSAPSPATGATRARSRAARGSGTHAPTLVASLYAHDVSERIALLDDALSDVDNRAWDVFDRGVALDALGRYAELTNPERYELFGAATAVVWMAG